MLLAVVFCAILIAVSAVSFNYLIHITVIEFIYQSKEQEEKFKQIIPQCLTENEMTQSDLVAFSNNKLEPTQRNKCFIKCLSVKLGFMDEAGNLIKEPYLESLKKDDPEEAPAYEKCFARSDLIKDDPCETAYAFKECVKPSV